MAVWPKELLNASCLSLLPGFKSGLGQVRKLPVTCGSMVIFTGYSGFIHQLQLASCDLAAIWQKK